MALAFDGVKLKRWRLQRALSQEQLSAISGIGTRTIQRIEQGGNASLETAKALSAAIAVPVSSLTKSVSLIRRITPLMIVIDMAPVRCRFIGLGFSIVETGNPACVGLKAGDTYMILASAGFMEIDYKRANVARLIGQTISYIHVTSIEQAKQRLPTAAMVLEEVRTTGGTIELLVEEANQYMIFAEKLGGRIG